MIRFERFARFTVTRDAFFVTLAAALLMLALSYDSPLALWIGATAALVFSLSLIMRSYRLTEERFTRSEVWRALFPDERPAEPAGRELAQARFNELLLHFAKSAAGIAAFLYVAAMLLSVGKG
jgi:Ca2+/Na+ antiporter